MQFLNLYHSLNLVVKFYKRQSHLGHRANSVSSPDTIIWKSMHRLNSLKKFRVAIKFCPNFVTFTQIMIFRTLWI